jgi:hypothetical protein
LNLIPSPGNAVNADIAVIAVNGKRETRSEFLCGV